MFKILQYSKDGDGRDLYCSEMPCYWRAFLEGLTLAQVSPFPRVPSSWFRNFCHNSLIWLPASLGFHVPSLVLETWASLCFLVFFHHSSLLLSKVGSPHSTTEPYQALFLSLKLGQPLTHRGGPHTIIITMAEFVAPSFSTFRVRMITRSKVKYTSSKVCLT